MLEARNTTGASAAIESAHRVFRRRLFVDWGASDHPLADLSAYVLEAKRDHALTATIPDEIQLIEGYAAGKLTVTLAGEFDGHALADQFAPYNRRSVFYSSGLMLGGAVSYLLGVVLEDGTEEWWPQFTGVVQDVTTDRGTGEVTLQCFDNAERMRTSVDLPPYAVWQDYLQDGYKRGGLIDSSSIIDLAARSAGFTMGPRYPWPLFDGFLRTTGDNPYGPVLSVPFHGSVLPEFGSCDGAMTFHLTESWENNEYAYRSEAYRPGPHGYLALNAVPPARESWGVKKYWFDEWDGNAGTVFGTWILGAWVYWTGSNVDGNSVVMEVQVRQNLLQLYISGDTGAVEARLKEPDGFHPWTNTPLRLGAVGWHYIQAFFIVNNASEYGMRVRIDDQHSSESRWTGRNAVNRNDPISGLVTISNKYAISDAFVCNSYRTSAYERYTYDTTPANTASVSWGRNRITHTLRESGREAWELAKEVSAAEYGTVFFDEAGRFIFWDYKAVIDRQAQSLRTFTLDDLSELAMRNTLDSVRNVWTVTTETARSRDGIAYDLGRDGVPFYRAGNGQLFPSTFILPNNSSNVYYFQVNDHTMSINPWRIPYMAENHPWEQETPIFGNKSYTGDRYRISGPGSEQKLQTRHLARLYLTNGFAEPVGFVLVSTGQPRFRIAGRMIFEDEPSTWTVRAPESVKTYGERVIELSGNFWLQDRWQTEAMLTEVVNRMGRPIPVSEKITVPGDPRLQIGDTVTLTDENGFGERIKVQILGIERRDSLDEGLSDTYTIEVIEPPGPGQWDHPVIGQWDTSMIWG